MSKHTLNGLPAKRIVCGEGTAHLGGGIAYTGEEWHDMLDELAQEGEFDYDDDGEICGVSTRRYETTCNTCHGDRVVLAYDETKFTEAQKIEHQEQLDYEAEYEAERRAEHFMDCRAAGCDPWR